VPRQAGYDESFQDQRDELPDACLAFIQKKRDTPFFAVASFINPHDICFAYLAHQGKDQHNVLKLYQQASTLPDDKLPPLPDNFAVPQGEPDGIAARLSPKATTPGITMRRQYTDRDWRIYRWIYCRLTEKVDRQIGKILNGLGKGGFLDNTLIVFTSDHGNMDASHKLASKSLFYEESVGVPFVMHYRGAIPAAQVDPNRLVSTGLDILPTLCDYAGVTAPEHLLGNSLRPVAEGHPPAQWRSFVPSENGWGRMIRSQRFKYCVYDSGEKNRESLVDLQNDPGEMQNLATDPSHSQVLSEHRQLLRGWAETSDDKAIPRFSVTG
jgi:arylsulfatase A-like enzyme